MGNKELKATFDIPSDARCHERQIPFPIQRLACDLPNKMMTAID